jgi:hypothetical protein
VAGEEENGGGEKKGAQEATTPVLKGVGGMEQRRGGSGQGRHHTLRRWGRGVGAARRSGGNGPRPMGAGGVARPCRAASSSRGGQWLTGGPGATVMGAGAKQFKSFPNSNCSKQFQTFPNSGRSKKCFPLLKKLK